LSDLEILKGVLAVYVGVVAFYGVVAALLVREKVDDEIRSVATQGGGSIEGQLRAIRGFAGGAVKGYGYLTLLFALGYGLYRYREGTFVLLLVVAVAYLIDHALASRGRLRGVVRLFPRRKRPRP
jgi:hypothetical protein